MTCRVALVDEHTLFLEGLSALLTAQPGLSIALATSQPAEAPEAIAEAQVDVILMEAAFEQISPVAFVQRLRRLHPAGLPLIVSGRRPDALVGELLAAGAVGFVAKQQPLATLVEAIKRVQTGQRYDPAGLEETSPPAVPGNPLALLTVREREVFELILQAMPSAQIAQRLLISVRTLETHRHSLMKKLKVRSAQELIIFAARRGLIPPEEPELLRGGR